MPVDKSIVDEQIRSLGDFNQWFTKKEMQHLPEVMHPGETIKALTSGFYDGNTWLIVVTDQRLLFLDKGILYGLKQVEMPLRQISATSHKTGLVLGELHMSTSAGKSILKNIQKADVAKVAAIVSTLVRDAHAPAQAAAPVAAPATDLASQLERLAALKDRGILTAEEFAAQKAKLLS